MLFEDRLETLYRLRSIWAPRALDGEDDGAWKILTAIEELIAVYEGPHGIAAGVAAAAARGGDR